MTLTIEELLQALNNPETTVTLENSKETWNRIGNRDAFSELGLEASELDAFLSEWINDNPYSNI